MSGTLGRMAAVLVSEIAYRCVLEHVTELPGEALGQGAPYEVVGMKEGDCAFIPHGETAHVEVGFHLLLDVQWQPGGRFEPVELPGRAVIAILAGVAKVIDFKMDALARPGA